MSKHHKLRKYRLELWIKDSRCYVCGQKIERYYDCTIEHIVPKSLGGSNKKRNLGISHKDCNYRRANIRCKLVMETFGNPYRRISNKTKTQHDENFKVLVSEWKKKLRQQYLDEQEKKKPVSKSVKKVAGTFLILNNAQNQDELA